jgi:hypothetical protein
MSELEGLSKPLVMQMQSGQSWLGVSQQTTLCRWVTKTAMVYEFAAESHVAPFFSPEERHRFRVERMVPESVWGVWIGHYGGPAPNSYAKALHLRDVILPDHATGTAGLVFTVTVNRFVAQLLGVRGATGRAPLKLDDEPEKRIQIRFPVFGAKWPPNVLFDDDANSIEGFSMRFSDSGPRR